MQIHTQGRREVYFFSTKAGCSSCTSGKSFVINHGPKPSNAQETAAGRFTGDYDTTFLFKVLFYELQINTTIQVINILWRVRSKPKKNLSHIRYSHRCLLNFRSSRPGDRRQHSDSLWAGRSRGRIPVGREIFRARPDRPWDPPILLYNGEYFPEVNRPGRDVNRPIIPIQ